MSKEKWLVWEALKLAYRQVLEISTSVEGESERGMPRNVEIKARCADVEEMAGKAVELSDSLGIIIHQTDTFFHCPNARLKLRVINDNVGALNVEIKARCADVEEMAGKAVELSDSLDIIIHQTDTFFHCPNARLKLRVIKDNVGALNVEIKARCADVEEMAGKAVELSDSLGIIIHQTDTFFHCPNARLKLRVINDNVGALNVEIKARCADVEEMAGKAVELSDSLGIIIHQTDTFFHCPNARLKLRVINDNVGALNVEIKARCADVEEMAGKAVELSNSLGIIIYQTDTFHCPNARLKLRVINDNVGALNVEIKARCADVEEMAGKAVELSDSLGIIIHQTDTFFHCPNARLKLRVINDNVGALNVEIKARCADVEEMAGKAVELSDSLGIIIHQTDTFFHCPNARLKLRVINDNVGALNVEIKARCADVEEMAGKAVELSDSLGIIIHQTDTFFHCPNARLKLRVINDNVGALNVEIKARCADVEEMAGKTVELSDSLGIIIHQTDTFFHCPNARLKLRVINDNVGALRPGART